MGCKKHKFSDGGKVRKSEYGEPTFGSTLLAAVGIGDGFSGGTAKKPSASKPPPANKPQRMNIANAASSFKDVMKKREEDLNQ